MKKKILFVHTRELCYFSGSFFLKQMQQACLSYGVDAEYIALEDEEDFDAFEKRIGTSIDGVVDMNSKLPYFILDNDERLLDAMGAPFYNYIVDHPLYHHPGLVFPIKNYHAIGIDEKHCEYMEEYYSHLQSVHYLPIGATRYEKQIPFDKREISILFSGTYEDERKIWSNFRGMCKKLQPEFPDGASPIWKLGQEVADLMLRGKGGKEMPMEEALLSCVSLEKLQAGYYVVKEFPVLMNYLYLVDKYVRNVRRKKVLEYVGSLGIPMAVIGEGWEITGLSDMKHVKLCGAKRMEESFAMMANSRVVLDVNPLFAKGVHDRVTCALANGALAISDMTPREELPEVVNYDNWHLESLGECLMHMGKEEIECRVAAGTERYFKELSWEAYGRKLLEILA